MVFRLSYIFLSETKHELVSHLTVNFQQIQWKVPGVLIYLKGYTTFKNWGFPPSREALKVLICLRMVSRQALYCGKTEEKNDSICISITDPLPKTENLYLFVVYLLCPMVFHLDHSQLCISAFGRRCKGAMAKHVKFWRQRSENAMATRKDSKAKEWYYYCSFAFALSHSHLCIFVFAFFFLYFI